MNTIQWIHIRNPLYLLGIIFLLVSYSATYGEKVGKITYQGYPEDFQNKVMTVPYNMVALSENIYVNAPESTNIIVDTPSIFFILDHSGSMYARNYEMDVDGNRFIVTSALIDTIHAKYPTAEVGLAVFNTSLYFNQNDDERFVALNDSSGAYLKLLRLNETYPPDNLTGYQILKKYLTTRQRWADNSVNYFVDLDYLPNPRPAGGTNITLGFRAAKDAMSKASFPKKDQFVVFISDGEATEPSNDPVFMNEFISGNDVPTTYTVFFSKNSTAPQTLTDMNDNIKDNGYSQTNKKSQLWPYTNTTSDALLKFLMEKVVNNFSKVQTTIPKDLIINGQTLGATWDPVEKKFIFPDIFPLTDDTTDFSFDIQYQVMYDSLDNEGDTVPVVIDTTIDIDFKVAIDQSMLIPTTGFKADYWDRNLELYHNNTKVTLIEGTMNELEIRFFYDPLDAKYTYKQKILVDIRTAIGTTIDTDQFELKKHGTNNYYFSTFKRVVDPINVTPNDNIIQHVGGDAFIFTFRNNEKNKLPLDTLVYKVPVEGYKEVALEECIYFDKNADGKIDIITIKMKGDNIQSNINPLLGAMTLPKFRDFEVVDTTVLGNTITLKVREKNLKTITNSTSEDFINVEKELYLPDCGHLLPQKKMIIDSVAPVIVKASYVDSLKFNGKDLLTITYSEKINTVTEKIPFAYYQSNNNKQYSAELKTQSHIGDESIFEVVSVENNLRIKDGDSIHISWIPNNNIVDLKGNEQKNKKNIKRPIEGTFVKDDLEITNVLYFDTDANGTVDSIYFDMEGSNISLHAQEVLNTIDLPDYRIFSVKSSFAYTSGIGLIVESDKVNTAVKSSEKIVLKDDTELSSGAILKSCDLEIEDKMAPVIMEASLIDSLKENTQDYLMVMFSEKVKKTEQNEPFVLYSRVHNLAYSLVVSDEKLIDDKLKIQFKVNNVLDSNALVSQVLPGDSMNISWIYGEDENVQDEEGNSQRNEFNIKRLIKLTQIPLNYELDLRATLLRNNTLALPSVITNNKELKTLLPKPEKVSQKGYTGYRDIMFISLQPIDGSQLSSRDKFSATITIYDALGNIIQKKQPMIENPEGKNLVYIWSGENRQSRKVTTYGYFALVEVDYLFEEGSGFRTLRKEEKRIILGVSK